MNDSNTRKVTANLCLSLDGRYNGPGGPADLSAIIPYASTEVSRDQLSRIHEGKTTALLGRGNAEGFLGFWPTMLDDDTADPRDRGYAKWLVDVEKVVLSRTLTEAPWDNARIVDGPIADVVAELKSDGEGDIIVNSSASVIKDLLAQDLLDRLYLIITPEITGAGQRLFDDGLPASKWRLTHQETGELGEIALVYDRQR